MTTVSFPALSQLKIWFSSKRSTSTAFFERLPEINGKCKKVFDYIISKKSTSRFYTFVNKNLFGNVSESSHFGFETDLNKIDKYFNQSLFETKKIFNFS